MFNGQGHILTIHGHAVGPQGSTDNISFDLIQINEYPNSTGNICEFNITEDVFDISGSVSYYSFAYSFGRPIPNVEFSTADSTVTSDEDGIFKIESLEVGNYQVSPSKSAFAGNTSNYFDGLSAVDASRIARFKGETYQLDSKHAHSVFVHYRTS